MEGLQDGHLMSHGFGRTREEEEDAAVEAAVDVVQRQRCYAHAALFGLHDQLDDESEDFVRIALQHALPQLVHQPSGQVEDVGRDVASASAGHDR